VIKPLQAWADGDSDSDCLGSCMPCHPHHFMKPYAVLRGITSALLKEVPGQGAVVRREAACGIAADNLLTAPRPVNWCTTMSASS
jgi:hypothetical protein